MTWYAGDSNNVAREVKGVYVGNANGVAQKITRAYVGDANGVARQIYPKTYLPAAYQQVEYIEGTGTQYINTGVSQNNTNTALEMSVALTSNTYSDVAYVAGHYTSGKRFYIQLLNKKIYLGLGSGYWQNSADADTSKHTYKIDMYHLHVYMDGVSKSSSSGSFSRTANNANIWLFRGSVGSGSNPIVKGKIYNAKIWVSDSLQHDYYPCYRKSDDVAGLYDIITDTFLTNAGSGTFGVGPKHEEQL